MSQKDTRREKESAALLALKQGIALVRRGKQIHGLHLDGSSELIVKSKNHKNLWSNAYKALKEREQEDIEGQDECEENETDCLAVYTDGGSRGNPGQSAAGYVIMTIDEKILEEGGQYLGITTNNQAEYQAVKIAFEAVKKFQPKKIYFYLDSLLVVNQLNGEYKVKNRDFWPVHQDIKDSVKEYEEVEFQHVRREHNKLADAQVNIILDEREDLHKNKKVE